MTEYHEQCTANNNLEEEFGYKVGESDRATDEECKASGIKISDTEYDEKRADASDVAKENSSRPHSSLGRTDANTGG